MSRAGSRLGPPGSTPAPRAAEPNTLPELPEVETVRRAVERRLKGRRFSGGSISAVTFNRRPSPGLLNGLSGLRLEKVLRRGKYLIMRFSGNRVLTLHLGMSGRLVFGGASPHTRLILRFGSETLRFIDPRRFGRAGCALPRLGPEPLDKGFNSRYLYASLRGRRAPIKALLMDQRIVAGIGNIYATEALFEAGIRPGRAGRRLSRWQARRLCASVKKVLRAAVSLRGATLGDASYLDPLERPGKAQTRLKVYGRTAGACGHPLRDSRKVIGGRRSRYCPKCQK